MCVVSIYSHDFREFTLCMNLHGFNGCTWSAWIWMVVVNPVLFFFNSWFCKVFSIILWDTYWNTSSILLDFGAERLHHRALLVFDTTLGFSCTYITNITKAWAGPFCHTSVLCLLSVTLGQALQIRYLV